MPAEAMNPSVSDIDDYRAGKWIVDPVHSEVAFSVRHFGISKVRGRFDRFDATITTASDVTGSSVSATIYTDSVNTHNEQRDAHVRSADFLDVANHPTMAFRSTGLTAAQSGYVLEGELTLHGVTEPVSMQLELIGFGPDPASPDGGARLGLAATTEIERSKFGVAFNAPIPGGAMVLSDTVHISLDIQAVLQT